MRDQTRWARLVFVASMGPAAAVGGLKARASCYLYPLKVIISLCSVALKFVGDEMSPTNKNEPTSFETVNHTHYT